MISEKFIIGVTPESVSVLIIHFYFFVLFSIYTYIYIYIHTYILFTKKLKKYKTFAPSPIPFTKAGECFSATLTLA